MKVSRKIADIQIQLSKKGSSAAHGKVLNSSGSYLPNQTKLKLEHALSKLNAKKRLVNLKILKKVLLNGFTDWTNFDDYKNNAIQLELDKDKWSEYIQWLSK